MTTSQKAMVIWFHEMGGVGKNMARHKLMRTISQHMPWVVWAFPEASPRPVTSRGGAEMPAWFDMEEYPVSGNEQHAGLPEAVAEVHTMVHNAIRLGFSRKRIVLSGFSQGGVLAIQAALTCEEPLGGVAALGAWLPAGALAAAKHPGTPFLWINGDCDTVVPLDVALRGAESLVDAGYSVRFCNYRGLRHAIGDWHIEDFLEFLMQIVPGDVQTRQSLQENDETNHALQQDAKAAQLSVEETTIESPKSCSTVHE